MSCCIGKSWGVWHHPASDSQCGSGHLHPGSCALTIFDPSGPGPDRLWGNGGTVQYKQCTASQSRPGALQSIVSQQSGGLVGGGLGWSVCMCAGKECQSSNVRGCGSHLLDGRGGWVLHGMPGALLHLLAIENFQTTALWQLASNLPLSPCLYRQQSGGAHTTEGGQAVIDNLCGAGKVTRRVRPIRGEWWQASKPRQAESGIQPKLPSLQSMFWT